MKIPKILVVHHERKDVSLEIDLNSLECYFDYNDIDPYTWEKTFIISNLDYLDGEPVERKVIEKLEYLVYDDDDLMNRYDTDNILDSFVEIFVD